MPRSNECNKTPIPDTTSQIDLGSARWRLIKQFRWPQWPARSRPLSQGMVPSHVLQSTIVSHSLRPGLQQPRYAKCSKNALTLAIRSLDTAENEPASLRPTWVEQTALVTASSPGTAKRPASPCSRRRCAAAPPAQASAGLKDTVAERPYNSHFCISECCQNSIRIQEILLDFIRNYQIEGLLNIFLTIWRNRKSQPILIRIGAKFDGTC